MNWAKRLVLSLAVMEAVVDLLNDSSQAEQAVGVVEIDAGDFDAGALSVVIDEALTGMHAGQVTRLSAHRCIGWGSLASIQ